MYQKNRSEKPTYWMLSLLLWTCWMSACDNTSAPSALTVTSLAFEDGGVIPTRHTCYGAGESPVLQITEIPDDTRQLALRIHNETDGEGTVLWLLWGISTSGYVAANVPAGIHAPGSLRQGVNSSGMIGYQPLCPPSGEVHTYAFTVWALDDNTIEGLDSAVDEAEFLRAIRDHVIGRGTLRGQFF